jgi:hypothetical protein
MIRFTGSADVRVYFRNYWLRRRFFAFFGTFQFRETTLTLDNCSVLELLPLLGDKSPICVERTTQTSKSALESLTAILEHFLGGVGKRERKIGERKGEFERGDRGK